MLIKADTYKNNNAIPIHYWTGKSSYDTIKKPKSEMESDHKKEGIVVKTTKAEPIMTGWRRMFVKVYTDEGHEIALALMVRCLRGMLN